MLPGRRLPWAAVLALGLAFGAGRLGERAYAGLSLRDNPEGTVVSWVLPGPLEGQGTRSPTLWRGDVVVSVNARAVNAAGFKALVESLAPGDEITIVYRRRADAEAHLDDALPAGDPNGEERTVTVKLAARSDWTGTIGLPLRADVAIAGAREGEIEKALLAHAAKAGIRDCEGGVAALLECLAKKQDADLDANSSPWVVQALRRPLSLDAVEDSLAGAVRAFANASKAVEGTGAACGTLVRLALDGRGDDPEPFDRAELARAVAEDDARWRKGSCDLVRLHRDSVSVESANAKEHFALLRASPEVASRAIRLALATLAEAHEVEAALAAVPAGVPGELRERVASAVRGEVAAACTVDGGLWVVGGSGKNTYDMAKVARVLDRGGADRYEWSAPFEGRDQFVFDLAGNDVYESAADFAGPGVAVFGLSVVDDRGGDDVYRSARMFTDACGLFGVGLALDRRGDDLYENTSGDGGFTQGVGYFGAGLLVDFAGADRYVGEKLAQGVGGPRGFGALIDVAGADDYRANGPSFPSLYDVEGAFAGLSQGFGYGVRGDAAGGVGALFDLAGDDHYEVGEFGQGCGYSYGLGVLHDAAGADEYVGQRYVQGSSAHQAAGILVDARGDDRYACKQVAFQGGAWDQSVAWLLDREGDDAYTGFGLGQGAAAQQAIGVLADLRGKDSYDSPQAQGESGANEYHYDADKVFSFSVLLDRGGQRDAYSTGRENRAVTLTGQRDDATPAASNLHGLCIDE